MKHVCSAWFVVWSVCNRNISQYSLWLPALFFCCFIVNIQGVESDRFWQSYELEKKDIIYIVTSNMKIRWR